MNYRERMKEYLKEPDEYSSDWGRWGILNKEQRTLIKRLLREMDSADEVIKHQYFEIERLHNIINKLEEYMKEERINNGKIDEWTIMEIQMKLQELKGSDKE